MKKAVLLFLGLIATFAMHAQVCKINNTTNDNIEVYSYVLNEAQNAVTVTVGNDSHEVSANVTVIVEVTYIGYIGTSKKETFSAKGLVKPNDTTDIIVPVKPHYNNNTSWNIKEVKVVSITGTKCL